MAPGVLFTVAATLMRHFPETIQDIVTLLNNDLESVREKFVLPSDVLKWAPILSARSICHFDTFAIAADYELSRRRAALLEAYPGSGNSDLSTRLGVVVSELQARVLESSGDWQQFKMLYDGYYLHLEKDEREAIDKSFTGLGRQFEDVRGHGSAMKVLSQRWSACFELVLTEAGRNGYAGVLEQRRAWMAETFPGRITQVTERIQQLTVTRARILQDSVALWNEQQVALFNLTADRLATGDLCITTSRYLALLQELDEQGKAQTALLDEIKYFVRQTEIYTTTLKHSTIEGDHSIKDIRDSFKRYEMIMNQSTCALERCAAFQDDLRASRSTLEQARDRL